MAPDHKKQLLVAQRLSPGLQPRSAVDDWHPLDEDMGDSAGNEIDNDWARRALDLLDLLKPRDFDRVCGAIISQVCTVE